jgi:ABC-type sugar transport system ATPase subunit
VDAPLRGRIRQELKLQQRQTGATWLWVTHDQSEALALGDRVAVMHGGRLEQVDVPQRILQSPASRHVAVLVGSPPMNLLTGRLGQGGFESSAGRLSCKDESPRTETVILGIRPQHLRPCRDGEPGFAAQVLLVECDEDGWVVTGQAGAARLVWRVSGGPPAVGETMHVTCDWDQVQLFDPDTGRRLPHTGSTA